MSHYHFPRTALRPSIVTIGTILALVACSRPAADESTRQLMATPPPQTEFQPSVQSLTTAPPPPAQQPSSTAVEPTSSTTPTAMATNTPSGITATPFNTHPDLTWVRKQFGTVWNIEYPAEWTVNELGLHEGALSLEGMYKDRRYSVSFVFPKLGDVLADTGTTLDSLTFEQWLAYELAQATPLHSDTFVIEELIVAGAPAKKVVGIVDPRYTTDVSNVYIWRQDDMNPRGISIGRADAGATDLIAMSELLDRFLAGIADPQGTNE
jgi:hypothetical protein